jgi:quercetin dioxygenase-like cupin family protein
MSQSSLMKPIRRVVTGNDANGKSTVTWDGPSPYAHAASMGQGRGHTDLWAWTESPAPLSGKNDDGNLKYDFPGPPNGGHLRVIQGVGKPLDYDAATDPNIVAPHAPKLRAPGRTWDRGGHNFYSGGMHKTETVDYAIMLEGERTLVLDDQDVNWKPGDVVIDVGAWHQWSSRAPGGSLVMFDMISATFVDGPLGLVQGNDRVMTAAANHAVPAGVTPTRRIVCLDKAPNKSTLASDAATPDVRTDPARPGFAMQRLWVTDGTPAKIVQETLHLPHALTPPKNGSVMRTITFPPDATWRGRVGEREVKAFFKAMGSPAASTWSADAKHPYMQKTETLEFALVTDGEIVLVLDTQDVTLKKGEFAIIRGSNHAWSNRTGKPATIALATHDGKY